MCQANFQLSGEGNEDSAGELHTIVEVDLQGAPKGGYVFVHHGLGYGGGSLVVGWIEADEPAEAVLTSQDVAVSHWCLGQGSY